MKIVKQPNPSLRMSEKILKTIQEFKEDKITHDELLDDMGETLRESEKIYGLQPQLPVFGHLLNHCDLLFSTDENIDRMIQFLDDHLKDYELKIINHSNVKVNDGVMFLSPPDGFVENVFFAMNTDISDKHFKLFLKLYQKGLIIVPPKVNSKDHSAIIAFITDHM